MSWAWVFPTTVSAILIFIGWRVVYTNAKKLATRSETYAINSRITTLLTDIQKLAEEFWFKSQFNDQPQHYDLLMLAKIKLLGAKLDMLKNRKIDIYEIERQKFPLRKACTYRSFDINTLSDAEKREQVDGILQVITSIEMKIDEKLTSTFPPNYE
ncbi:hypothetical protein G3465_12170 [Shewanella baltica]|uniref:hypothetical protein n=1 Tax=Shewanella baltica TaxID=62322 RepID=UPI00217F0272|nr:hypothetical protein [Shewanella baltica]MCS6153649.1 hypothetical protein [Shewanella baltica]